MGKKVSHKKCGVKGCKEKIRCSGLCSRHYFQHLRGNPFTLKRENKTCLFEGCNEKTRANGYCSKHYDKVRKTTQKRKEQIKKYQTKYRNSEVGKERRGIDARIRRAKKRGATIEVFSNKEIFERDFYTCCICGLGIDSSFCFPNPLSISLEHFVPLSKGGAHSRENVSCAHLICNIRKNNKLLQPSFEGASI